MTPIRKGVPVPLKYGASIQAVADLLIIPAVIFMAIRGINKLKKPPAPTPYALPPRQEMLLEQICDVLTKC